MMERHLPMQVRVYPTEQQHEHKTRPRVPVNWLLTDDTETVTDQSMRLLFGSGKLETVLQHDNGELERFTVREVLYYADDLPQFRPETFKALERYVQTHKAGVDYRGIFPTYDDQEHGQLDVEPNPDIELIPHSKYVENYICKCAYSTHPDREYEPATINGYNLSFDMWRHVTAVSHAQGLFYGGLSGQLLNGVDWAPQYRETKAGIGMRRELTRRRKGNNKEDVVAHLVDTSELVRALTGKPHTLLSAGRAFGCKITKYDGDEIHDPEKNSGLTGEPLQKLLGHYISYNRNDVDATAELWEKAMTLFLRHPIQLRPELTFSPASISKQYIRDMDIHAPMCACRRCKSKKLGAWKFPIEVQGRCAVAFLGGRAECGIRLGSTPVVLTDFLSMYPTVMLLLGIWEQLTADNIACNEDTEAVRVFLDQLTVKDLYQPETWPQLCGVADVNAQDNLLPVRSPYSDSQASASGIGINYVTTLPGEPVSWTLLDLAACKILTGKVPEIVRAWRWYPSGKKQSTMKPMNLYGDPRLHFDPAKDNLMKFLIEQRQKAKTRHKQHKAAVPVKTLTRGERNPSPWRKIDNDFVEYYETLVWAIEQAALGNKEAQAALDRNHLDPEDIDIYREALGGWRSTADETAQEYRPIEQADCAYCARVARLELSASGGGESHAWMRDLQNTHEGKEQLRLARQHRDEYHANDNAVELWNADSDKCLCQDCEQERFLKVCANAIYGVFAEMNKNKRSAEKRENRDVCGIGGDIWSTSEPEQPGQFCFFPFACVITGGARLMLAMLQQAVESYGGHLVFMDTDSGCIPATKSGKFNGDIKVLSYKTVDVIRRRFNKLNPYDQSVVPEILKWEKPECDGDRYPDRPLYCTAISAKRYALYYKDHGNPEIVSVTEDDDNSDPVTTNIEIEKRSEHGLGLFMNPAVKDASDEKDARRPDWYREAWHYLISRYVLELSNVSEPVWLDYPALSKFPVKSLLSWEAFRKYNERKMPDGSRREIWDQVIPSNFYLAVHPARLEKMWNPDMRLVALFESDPRKWPDMEVFDMHTGRTHLISTKSVKDMTGNVICIKSYRDVLESYRKHPEIKYDGPDGERCRSDTRGILQPTHIVAMSYQHITKDSSSVATIGEAFAHRGPHVYRDDINMRIRGIARVVLKEHGFSKRKLSADTSTGIKQAEVFLSEKASISYRGAEQKYIVLAYKLARAELVSANVGVGHDSPSQVLARWQRWKELQNDADV
jgi:ketosteroid isomerase-like protein